MDFRVFFRFPQEPASLTVRTAVFPTTADRPEAGPYTFIISMDSPSDTGHATTGSPHPHL